MISEMKTGIWYVVIRESDDGTLRKGDRVFMHSDGVLVCIEADGFLPPEQVQDALKGAVLEVDKEWVSRKKQEHMDAIAKLEGL